MDEITEIHYQISILNDQLSTMKEYIKLRLSLEDWHGVMDAAVDIREIACQIKILESLVGKPSK